MTGSTADRRRIRRLMAGVTRRFWPLVKTLNLWLSGRVVAAISGIGIGQDAGELVADRLLDVGNDNCQCVTIVDPICGDRKRARCYHIAFEGRDDYVDLANSRVSGELEQDESMRFKRLFDRNRASDVEPQDSVFDQYCHDAPTAQNAIDALTGWTSAFPPSSKVLAGNHPLYADGRIVWALQHAGSIADKRILEVGPLEGMHTYMLNQQNPLSIDAIEANKQCFLRCLVAKEILQIDRARFHLGDALKWLEATDNQYDLAIASGVLYHMADPGLFLKKLAARCDKLFLWTHYFSDTAMPQTDARRQAFSGKIMEHVIDGIPVTYHERRYFNANETKAFCGGMRDRHYWMSREDILQLLSAFGFTEIEIAHDTPDHSGGPCFSVFANRPATSID